MNVMSGVAVTTVLDITSSTFVSSGAPVRYILSTTSLSVIIPIIFVFGYRYRATFRSHHACACSTVLFLSMVLTSRVIMSPIFMPVTP